MSGMPDTSGALSGLQLELLKLYADKTSEEDLKNIQRLIAKYFAEKAMDEADKIWEEKGYQANDLLTEHSRTPSSAAKK